MDRHTRKLMRSAERMVAEEANVVAAQERETFGEMWNRAAKVVEGVAGGGLPSSEVVPLRRVQDRRGLRSTLGPDSDSEIVFAFEDAADADQLYQMIVGLGLLYPGEIVVRHLGTQHNVGFAPHVVVTMPEIIEAAYELYREVVSGESEADEDMLNAMLDHYLSEAEVVSAGAPKGKAHGNPYHDPDTGKFADLDALEKKERGSWAYKDTKLKVTGTTKGKKGPVVRFGSTRHPCGRAAREKGKNIRCWAGAGERLLKVFKKRRAQEALDAADLQFLREIRSHYGSHGIL